MSTTDLHVIFGVGPSEFVVPASAVIQMESYAGATPVPGAPAHVAGLVQIRGRVLPVVDLRHRFGLEAADPTLDSRVVVVSHGGRTVGLLADRAREVVSLAADAFQSPPEVVSDQTAGYVDGIARTGARLLLRIDLARVIGKEELHAPER